MLTEHTDAKTKMQVILKANEFIEKSICIILIKNWFTCLDIEIFILFYSLNNNTCTGITVFFFLDNNNNS